jgi:hypothetical protein
MRGAPAAAAGPETGGAAPAEAGAVYRREFRLVAERAWCHWNRDLGSSSFGSFDRAYWGWKQKDLSDATLQYAALVVIEHARQRGVDRSLGPLLEGYVDFCLRLQHRNGSLDQCYPFERTPSVIYDILPALWAVYEGPYLQSPESRGKLETLIHRGVKFGLGHDELHGAIANHFAHYAYELYRYHQVFGDPDAQRKADGYLERVLALFDREEGWFVEYHGPDPGYQTRTMRYLAKIASLLDSDEIWKTLGRAAEFIDALLMPDGSLHPMLGARSTALVYPSGFERLAAREPRFQPLAERIRHGWERQRVPLPSWLDFDNALRLAVDAHEAAEVLAQSSPAAAPPCAGPDPAGERSLVQLQRAGITVWREPRRCVYVGQQLGGVVVVYTRDERGGWNLAHEDSGYVLCDPGRQRRWLTRMPGAGKAIETSPDRIVVEAGFLESLHDELSTPKLLLLRLLNLTVLRVQRLGDLFRRVVVRRLMGKRSRLPLRLRREITLAADRITVCDRLSGAIGKVKGRAQLFRCRRVTGTHMASARYFQPQEIEGALPDWHVALPLPGSGLCEMRTAVPAPTGGSLPEARRPRND